MEAVRVPPSAWITSQSTNSVRSPILDKSVMARNERPIKRWISCERPLGRPFVDSRGVRVRVERGNIAYSLVIQPLPRPLMNFGTDSSTLAVQMTRVLPTSMRTEPSAVEIKSGIILTGRICSGVRLSDR